MTLTGPKNHAYGSCGKSKSLCLAVLAALMFVFAAEVEFAVAQDIFGRIVGTVTDSSGGTVPGVKVTLENEATQVSREVTADKNGYFVAEELPAGSYLALSHLTGDFDPAAWEGVAAVYRRSGVTMQVRPLAAVERFFTGLDLLDPGVVSLPRWRPDSNDLGQPGQPTDAAVSVYGGLGRKP